MTRSNCGYEIIDGITIKQIEIVLGKNVNNHYVTWCCSKSDYYYQGNYFDNPLSAKKDFYKRAIREINYQKEQLAKQHVHKIKKEVSQ